MKKVCCIVNPVSGLKKSLKVYYEAKNHFEESKFNTSLFVSKYPNHIKEYISKIDKNMFDRIVIFGGDGTINEVVNGLYDSNNLQSFKIGVIPTGSGNSVAHDTDLLDVKVAIQKSVGSNVMKMDVNQVDFDSFTRLSVSVLGWGMFSFGNIRAEKLRILGPIRYDVASIITLLEKKIHKAEIVIEGVPKLLECAFIVGCNSKHTGKGMIVAPKGGFSDKKIDLITVGKDVSRFQVFDIFQKVYKGTHIDLPYVENIQVDSFKIDPGQKSFYNIDGDIVESQKASVRVIPEAINLLI
jgi:YegS/Rv2252/BmrU family lipid kinase|tara:strand:- start:11531 stop:12421 length:891 start_codon:yes stop_codon:yes gene_type:complete